MPCFCQMILSRHSTHVFHPESGVGRGYASRYPIFPRHDHLDKPSRPSVFQKDGKGDEATSVVSATESDSGEATSLSSTFVVLSSCCKVPFLLPNDRSTKLLTSLVAISFFCPCGMGLFCYPKAEKAGSKDAFEKADAG